MSDLELQIELAKLLPEKLQPVFVGNTSVGTDAKKGYWVVWWKGLCRALHETEWLHVCWLIEQDIATRQKIAFEKYQIALEKTVYGTNNQLGWITRDLILASWQQRAKALIEVKS